VTGQFPDFVIIGAMKSATSSLYWWLEARPDCFLASPKEVDFFSRDDRWERGAAWYGKFFAGAREGQVVGEASVSYTRPDLAPLAAERMKSLLPDAKLLMVLRHPVERLRSHYRHEVQRGRERRSLPEALDSGDSPYLASSRYFSCLRPYIERFPRQQIGVVRFEDLVFDGRPGWEQVLGHLGLPHGDPPGSAYNVSDQNRQWSPMMARMHRLGLFRVGAVLRLPAPIRRIGGRILLHDDAGYRGMLDRSRSAVVPEAALESLWADVDRLERWLGVRDRLWQRTPAPAASRAGR
jgi:hypothetical protein